jgi:hypothetical protein
MSQRVKIFDSKNNRSAKIVNGGALAVLPPEYNGIYSAEMTVIDQVYNVVPPAPDQYFVGSLLVITGDKTISTTTDATVYIYAAKADDEAYTAANVEVLPLKIARSSSIVIPNMNIRTLERGAYINASTTEVNVSVTLFGYYTLEPA